MEYVVSIIIGVFIGFVLTSCIVAGNDKKDN